MTATLGSTPKRASSSSTSPEVVPSEVVSFTVAMSVPLGARLDGVPDEDEAALRPRDGALDEQQVALGVGLHDGEVEGGGLAAAGPAGHAGAAEDPGGRGAGADGAGRPVHAVGAVAGTEATEAVALHDAAEALALADGGDVHALAGGEDVDRDLLADLVVAHVVEPQLDQADARLDAGLRVVAGEGLVELGGLLVAEGDLQRVVPVALVGLDLNHAARAHAQDGHRDDAVLVVPHLR